MPYYQDRIPTVYYQGLIKDEYLHRYDLYPEIIKDKNAIKISLVGEYGYSPAIPGRAFFRAYNFKDAEEKVKNYYFLKYIAYTFKNVFADEIKLFFSSFDPFKEEIPEFITKKFQNFMVEYLPRRETIKHDVFLNKLYPADVSGIIDCLEKEKNLNLNIEPALKKASKHPVFEEKFLQQQGKSYFLNTEKFPLRGVPNISGITLLRLPEKIQDFGYRLLDFYQNPNRYYSTDEASFMSNIQFDTISVDSMPLFSRIHHNKSKNINDEIFEFFILNTSYALAPFIINMRTRGVYHKNFDLKGFMALNEGLKKHFQNAQIKNIEVINKNHLAVTYQESNGSIKTSGVTFDELMFSAKTQEKLNNLISSVKNTVKSFIKK